MNAKSTPKTPKLKDWLNDAKTKLAAVDIPSASLDAELILSHALCVDRTFLHAHPEHMIDEIKLQKANSNLELRLQRTPIAYITGVKEFYGREFCVTPSTLIPRPESEDIIESLKQILPVSKDDDSQTSLVDIGTGSGCIGITAKLEFPYLDVTLSDISHDALKIAIKNAIKLSAKVSIVHSNLLDNIKVQPDIIVANLPYVDTHWERSPETNHEPELALFASDNGMTIIKQLIVQTISSLKNNGYLIIEADPIQHAELTSQAIKNNFILTNSLGYILTFIRQR